MMAVEPALLSQTIAPLLAAFLLGTLIGAERQYRNRSAGLRTNVLVAVGAAAFVVLGHRLNANAGATQMASYVVSGIGFLGAGVIMRDGGNVRGINTAATLWTSAAVGALAGAELLQEACLMTVIVLAGNIALRPLVNGINRLPFNERTSEARYQVHVTTTEAAADEMRDAITEALEGASYPTRGVSVYPRSDKSVEVVATLVSTAVDPGEIEKVVAKLAKNPRSIYATWSQRTMD
jgi:putative Mg2+ transporter-C (MgtC) family protein